MNSSKRNLILGYSVSLLLLLISGVASYVSISRLLASNDIVNHTHDVIRSLDDVIANVRLGEASQREYLLTGDESYMAPFNNAYQKTLTNVEEIKRLTNDNVEQQGDIPALSNLVESRFTVLRNVANIKKTTDTVPLESLSIGRVTMGQLGDLLKRMGNRENELLSLRTGKLKQFASTTPTIILIASILAILVTIISFLNTNNDFKKRNVLQQNLENRNEEISERIRILERLTSRIAAGDFSTRVADNERENLGVLADSIDKMAGSLETSFNSLADNEWQQTGLAELNEIMIGEKSAEMLTVNALNYIAAYTKVHTGAFYLSMPGDRLALSATYMIDKHALKSNINFGEGIAGQAAQSQKEINVQNIGDNEMVLHFAGGKIVPEAILAFPVFYEQKFKGVIEFAAGKDFTAVDREFFKTAAINVGIALHSARDHEKLQELLSETQAQSEELQSQHSELENINAELEAQAQKLQASEEELRVQQEELQEANSELEERSRLLEEKNEVILVRNLDIQRKAEELELSTKYKSEFLANMSHELRTPLNSILLLSRLLSENHNDNLNSDQIEYATVIQNSGKNLLTLIDEILDLSKIESGKMELDYTNVKIDDVAADLKSLFGPIAKEKNLEFIIHNDVDIAFIETDRLRVDQILRNLLSNALKFTKKGSVELTVTKDQKQMMFTVKDSGIGIPEAKQQLVFEAFQQADGSTRREFGGTGLGLSISRELAKLLGGNITLKSTEAVGSEFTLSLPLNKNEALEHPAKQIQQETRPVVSDQPIVLKQNDDQYISSVIPEALADDRNSIVKGDKCILIIEDDTGFALSLLDYTRSKGYKGIVAVRGDEGLALAKQFMPQGILLDVQLPIKSGWDVMDELKADPATRIIPVHMMSSHEVRMKSLSKGAVDFINKPVALEKLGEMIQKIERALAKSPKKVLIVEENRQHAEALAYFLQTYNILTEIKDSVGDGIDALNREEVDCVILDMGIPAQNNYNTLDEVKKAPGFENLPIIVFTGRNLSITEETRIRRYADTIVVKTAQSYQRILDEVSLFLHLVEENKQDKRAYKKTSGLAEILKGKTILVADDDVRNIFSLTKSLETFGVNVISATDGKEALNQLNANPKIDLVLMDMMMPEMDGYRSTQLIRENIKYRNLPVIAVTAKAMTGDREKCIEAGASDYITKPVDIDQLISLLRVWLYSNNKSA